MKNEELYWLIPATAGLRDGMKQNRWAEAFNFLCYFGKNRYPERVVIATSRRYSDLCMFSIFGYLFVNCLFSGFGINLDIYIPQDYDYYIRKNRARVRQKAGDH